MWVSVRLGDLLLFMLKKKELKEQQEMTQVVLEVGKLFVYSAAGRLVA